jgi:benzoate/toluate 1,2-dioxygenase reductase subunit
MSHSIALNFEDVVTRFIDSVRTRPLPTPLTVSGSTSRSTVATACAAPANAASNPASTTRGSYLEDALTEEEAAAGLALACQTRPKTDLVTAIAGSSEACKTRGRTYRARLHSVERLSETTIAFSLLYLCGPPPMVDAVRAWLGEQSVTQANFYYEKFAPSGVLATINEAPK